MTNMPTADSDGTACVADNGRAGPRCQGCNGCPTAPDEGCTCAEIAAVAGSRLSDSTIMALCDRLRDRILPPGGGADA